MAPPREQDSQAKKCNGCNTPRSCANDDGDDNRIDILLFDLDGTLYDHSCGYEEEIHSNIFKFMVETEGGKFNAITTLQEAQKE